MLEWVENEHEDWVEAFCGGYVRLVGVNTVETLCIGSGIACGAVGCRMPKLACEYRNKVDSRVERLLTSPAKTPSGWRVGRVHPILAHYI